MNEDEKTENNINEFYKLKENYEKSIEKMKKKILNSGLSKKDKQKEFKKLKPKCINCLKSGGTSFTSKFKDNSRELKAFCLANPPCKLNIVIHVGHFKPITQEIAEIEDEINKDKKEIINDKNKLIFSLIKTEKALNNFNEIKDNIKEWTSILEIYLNLYESLVDNPNTKNKLNNDLERSYLLINEIKTSMKKYDETNNLQFVTDSVEIYLNQLKPLLKNIQKNKYKENMVWFNTDDETYHLIQEKNSIKSLEVNDGQFETKSFAF